MILSIGTGLLCFCMIILLGRFCLRNRMHVEKRMERIFSKNQKVIIEPENIKIKKNPNYKIFSKLKIIDTINMELSSSGILMRAEEFLMIWIILIFVPSGLVMVVWGNAINATSLVIIGVVLPLILVRRSKQKRIDEFTIQLSDALITLGNCLRSGLSLIQGIESIGSEMPDPIGKEFKKVYREINYGVSIDKALTNLRDRVESEELDLIVSAILIQREVGGNLSVILDNVSETIRQRLKIKSEIKVLTATGRMSGYVVGFLPLIIGLLLMLLTPDYIGAFFRSSAGMWMLVAAGVLELIGFLLIQKIVTVKY